MELILKEDVENLGFKDDLVIVKNGYGRNFLIPQGKAMLATSSAKKVLAEKIKQSQNKQKEAISEAQKIVKKLEKLELKISAKSLESDKLFGSVTNVEVAKELSSNGFDIEKKCVQLSSNIKKTGTYIAKIRLHREVYFDLNFEVVKSAN
ncbi:MAG: 50S ribosomal protein L9 [Flavobacteriaceae bacterium]|jgi:large subunit ribosomal protein L9|nr:50S ribosomal protein L9 [Flavobacteriaceae bacterium]|tara:strand:- start:271 stop:720 length:450 start_codon:yes stop_codon:yes gene_type:complete